MRVCISHSADIDASSFCKVLHSLDELTVVSSMCEAYEANRGYERKGVTLTTTDAAELSGYLHSIDPESGTHALLTAHEVHLIPATTITSLKPAQLPEGAPTQLKPGVTASRGVDMETLVAGLRARHIDVDTAQQDVHIFGGLAVVEAPYGPDCVRSVNESVLMRVRKVVREIVEEHGNG